MLEVVSSAADSEKMQQKRAGKLNIRERVERKEDTGSVCRPSVTVLPAVQMSCNCSKHPRHHLEEHAGDRDAESIPGHKLKYYWRGGTKWVGHIFPSLPRGHVLKVSQFT